MRRLTYAERVCFFWLALLLATVLANWSGCGPAHWGLFRG